MRSLTKTAGWCVPKIPILERVHPDRSRGAAHHLLQCLKFFLFTFLRTLLHFFALFKNSTLLFSSDSALFAKKNGAGGGEQVASRKYGTSFYRYILTSLRLYFLFPSETASARRAEYQRWPLVPDTAAGAALAP